MFLHSFSFLLPLQVHKQSMLQKPEPSTIQQVAVLVNGYKEAGVHTIIFNAEGIISGVYIYRIYADDLIQTNKMMLMK